MSIQIFKEWNPYVRNRMCRQYLLTCYALHNWLVEIDSLDVQWKEGDASDWKGEH